MTQTAPRSGRKKRWSGWTKKEERLKKAEAEGGGEMRTYADIWRCSSCTVCVVHVASTANNTSQPVCVYCMQPGHANGLARGLPRCLRESGTQRERAEVCGSTGRPCWANQKEIRRKQGWTAQGATGDGHELHKAEFSAPVTTIKLSSASSHFLSHTHTHTHTHTDT